MVAMQKGSRIQGTIEKLVSGGEGLMHVDGRAMFIPRVCPSETVSAEVVEVKKHWGRCSSPTILKNSQQRRDPFCQHYKQCGGCTWQHLSYESQLEYKQTLALEAFKRHAGIVFPELNIMCSSEPEGYRARIRPVILPEGKAAFRAPRSNVLIPIEHCPVSTKGINRFFQELPNLLSKGIKINASPHVFGNNEHYWVEGQHSLASVSITPPSMNQKNFSFPPSAFFQSNLELLGSLIESVVNSIPADNASTPRTLALDLYGGVGIFGAFLSDSFEQIIGVDSDPAVGRHWQNHVKDKGKFYCMTLEKWLSTHKDCRPNLIVIDPPRKGLSSYIRRALALLEAPYIAYVSCNPVTQARDIREFVHSGYHLRDLRLFDFYPQTPHVETLAILERR